MVLSVRQSGAWVNPTDVYVRQGGIWTPAQEVLVRQAGVWVSIYQAEVAVALVSRTTSADISSLFDASVWSSTKRKRVIIPNGVSVSANDWRGALYLPTGATAWGGELIVDNYGTLYGIGGVAYSNSGEGGAGVGSAIVGLTGQRITVNNSGGIYAGGGAGGQGGQGGGGWYTYTAVDYGWRYNGQNLWAGNPFNFIRWDGPVVSYVGPDDTSIQIGNTIYYKGWVAADSEYTIRRIDMATAWTSGGAGGAGGRGQGSDGAASTGAGGGAPGTNAGWGGQGGTGATWGTQGSTGASGAAGNNGGGAGGAAGGLGGRYAYGYLTINNTGTTAGRLALAA